MKHFKVLFFFIIFIIFSLSVHAQETKEHPLIRPFPESKLMPKGDYKDFSEYAFNVTNPQTKKAVKKAVKGKFWKLTYRLYDSQGKWDGSHSILEYRENYKQAALEKAGTILYENQGYLTFTLPGEDGSTTWCEVHIWNKSQQDICVIEEAGFKKSLTFGPAEMKAALDKDGHVQLYGILFDLDQATLKAESVKQLQHVITLMKDNPELNIEVQGHTDDQGSDDYNLKLSQRRAETVLAYLGLFGIDTSRLVPKGYGESKPVMPNNTEEGRAKNRRVELVKTAAIDTSSKDVKSKDLAQLILGTWEMVPNKRALKGSITFDQGGTYEMNEKLQDGSGVGTKGEYKLDTGVTPEKIDLCLGKCGKPGSEWTTRFGIMRVLSNEKVEIHTSPNSKYPSEFSNDTSEEFTMILTRVK